MNQPTNDLSKKLFNLRETALMLGISERTLWSETAPRGSLPAVKVRNRILYTLQDIERWIESKKIPLGQEQ